MLSQKTPKVNNTTRLIMSQFHHNLIFSNRAYEFLFQSILNLLCKQIKAIREENDFLATPT